MFTIVLDVNSVNNKQDEILGYSLMALILGTYDQKVLNDSISGNLFLAGWVHTHGSLRSINEAYDEIIAKLKGQGLPEYRRFFAMAVKALGEANTRKAVKTHQY